MDVDVQARRHASLYNHRIVSGRTDAILPVNPSVDAASDMQGQTRCVGRDALSLVRARPARADWCELAQDARQARNGIEAICSCHRVRDVAL